MKIIVLRGLPGSGKGTVAESLKPLVGAVEVIEADNYKREYRRSNPGTPFLEALDYCYKKTLERLEELSKEGQAETVIVEELFNDGEFVKAVQDFAERNNVPIFWFYVRREMEQLLKVENERKREIKNPREVLEELQKEIEDIRIDGEVTIDNNGPMEDLDKEVARVVSLTEMTEPTKELKLK